MHQEVQMHIYGSLPISDCNSCEGALAPPPGSPGALPAGRPSEIVVNVFVKTRPKPAYDRQGLDWIVRPIFLQLHFAFLEHIQPILRPRLTSFDPKT